MCPGKGYEALCVGGDRYVRYLKRCFVRLAIDIRPIALLAMPVLGYTSNEFEQTRNADFTMRQ